MMNSNNKLFLVVLFGIALLVGVYFYTRSNNAEPATTPVMTGDQQTTRKVAEAGDSAKYQDYSKAAFDAASDKRRVYFFHAPWCPTCRPANLDFLENADQLPDDVVVFKTDYDTSTELKERYGVTYQHTYVQVDENGELVKIWNGGGVDEVIENLL